MSSNIFSESQTCPMESQKRLMDEIIRLFELLIRPNIGINRPIEQLIRPESG
ncbi:hypothetical protein [Peribacillus muralis]|uniref:hypothetical protein n=1 Tax=Peribacillus muralis TaxID=264697 RepID=UPI0036715803